MVREGRLAGRVEVGVSREDAGVVLSVRDFGIGISGWFRPRMFDRFSQADSSDSRAKGGTGLGLSISKAIVERLEGTITFESELGRGNAFRVSLPTAIRASADSSVEDGAHS